MERRGSAHTATLLSERGLLLRVLDNPLLALMSLQAASEHSPTDRDLRAEIDDCYGEVDATPVTQTNLHAASIFAAVPLSPSGLPFAAAAGGQQESGQESHTHVAGASNHADTVALASPVTSVRLSAGRPLLSRVDGLLTPAEVQAVLRLGKEKESIPRPPPMVCTSSLESARRMLANAPVNVAPSDVMKDLRAIEEKRSADSVCFNAEKSADMARWLQHSTSVEFHHGHGSTLLEQLGARVEAITGLADQHGASWIVTSYTAASSAGYAEHNDCGEGPKLDRIATVLIYLTDLAPSERGATIFTNVEISNGTNIHVQPRAGSAAVWSSISPETGKCDPHARHIAEAVASSSKSTKVILQRWYHAEASVGLDLPPPAPFLEGYLPQTPPIICDGEDMCRRYNTWTNY